MFFFDKILKCVSDKVIIPFELRPVFDRPMDAIVKILERPTPGPMLKNVCISVSLFNEIYQDH